VNVPPTDPGRASARLRWVGSILAGVVAVSPLFRAGWDLWIQTFVHVVVSFLAVIVIVVAWTRGEEVREEIRKTAVSPLGVLVLLFGAAGLVSSFLSPFKHSVVPEVLNTVNVVFLVGGMVLFVRQEDGFVRRFSESLRLSALIAAGVAVAWAYRGVRDFSGLAGVPEPFHAPMVNPNVLAGFLVLMGPLVWNTADPASPKRLGRWMPIVLWATVLIGTRSVVGLLAALLQVLCQPGVKNHIRSKALVWSSAVLLFLGSAAALLWSKVSLWGLDYERWGWWRTALRMWVKNPLFGVGPGAFGEAYPGYRIHAFDLNSLYAHDLFLEMGAERGLVGFLLFATVLLMVFSRRDHGGTVPDDRAPFKTGLMGFIIFNLFHMSFTFPAVSWVAWSMIGVLAAERVTEKPVLPWLEKISAKAVLSAAAVTGAGLIVSSLLLFRAQQYVVFGWQSFQKENWEEAGQFAWFSLKLFPFSPEAGSLYGWSLLKQGQLDKAESRFRRNIELSPYTARFHSELGGVLMAQMKIAEAVTSFESATNYLPLNPSYWYQRAQAEDALQRRVEAVQSYRQTLDVARRQYGDEMFNSRWKDVLEKAEQRLKELS